MARKTIMELFDAFETPKQVHAEKLDILKSQPAPLPQDATIEKDKSEADDSTHLSPILLDPFPDDPFKPYADHRLTELADSIRQYGILSAILVRKKEGGRFEILSGHNRVTAAKLLGLDTVPCVVRNVDDLDAALIVTDSNLNQREQLLPSEKAAAYKLQLEALKKQGKNIEKYESKAYGNNENQNNSQLGNLDNKTTIYRFVRLTYLLPEILRAVDDEKIGIVSGEYISYLNKDEQETIYQYFFEEKRGTLDVKTAKLIRQRASEVDLTYMELEKLLRKAAKSQEFKKVTLKMSKIDKLLPSGVSQRQAQEYIVGALEFYNAHKDDFQ